MSYYRGDLAADLARIDGESFAPELQRIGKLIGYGRAQQILQVLWAKHLAANGYPTIGALLPEPLEAQQPASAQPVAAPDGARKVFICDVCEGVYADEPVTNCDCTVSEKTTFSEGYIVMLSAAQKPEGVE